MDIGVFRGIRIRNIVPGADYANLQICIIRLSEYIEIVLHACILHVVPL